MMLKFPFGRPDSETMREIARQAEVGWDYQVIRYEGEAIGYGDAPDDADAQALLDAAETVTGVRPSVV